jgi:hypothetical protein
MPCANFGEQPITLPQVWCSSHVFSILMDDSLKLPYTAMIFLQDNIYLKRELTFEHVKPRLLGKDKSTKMILLHQLMV